MSVAMSISCRYSVVVRMSVFVVRKDIRWQTDIESRSSRCCVVFIQVTSCYSYIYIFTSLLSPPCCPSRWSWQCWHADTMIAVIILLLHIIIAGWRTYKTLPIPLFSRSLSPSLSISIYCPLYFRLMYAVRAYEPYPFLAYNKLRPDYNPK